MKLYVINLDRSQERLQRMNDIFQGANLTLTRISAIDGTTLSDDARIRLTQKRLWPEALTPGEIACFLSHKKAIEHIASGHNAYGAVFEDDIILSSHAADFLCQSGWIPEDADLVKLETHGKKTWLGPEQPTGHNDFQLARLKSTHIMAAGYILSRKAAQRLLTDMDLVVAPFDHFLFNANYPIFHKLVIYQLDPAIVIQAGLQSTLESDRAHHQAIKKTKRTLSVTLKREIRRIFRRTKTGLWGIFINAFSQDSWKRVPFENKTHD